jgi:hypothetical protein
MPILLQHRVGRLVEARFTTPIDQAELEEFDRARALIRARLSEDRIVVMDFRPASLLSPELADALVSVLHGPTHGLGRNGVLVPTASPTVAMQLTRIVREARSNRRRVFREVREVCAWLGEVLDASESSRLKQFLAEDLAPAR